MIVTELKIKRPLPVIFRYQKLFSNICSKVLDGYKRLIFLKKVRGGSAIIFFLLVISLLITLFFLILILRMKNKRQVHYAVLLTMVSAIIWDIAVILHIVLEESQVNYFFKLLYFLGPITVSVSILFLGLIFAYYRIEFARGWWLLLIPPFISILMLFTNHHHHLFFTTLSLIPSQQEYGAYFMWHSIISYAYIGVGLTYLVVFSIKNYGFYSRQSILISSGILVSLLADSFSTLGITNWPTYVENIAFAVTIIFFMLAMFKYDFLNITPIANKIILNSLTDSYVIINDNYEIIECNDAFKKLFPNEHFLRRKANYMMLLRKYDLESGEVALLDSIEKSFKLKENTSFDFSREIGGEMFHYKIEVIPIYKRSTQAGVIILTKDITESKRHLDQITILNQQLQDLVVKDGLTQVYNRYFFEERLQQEIDRVVKQKNYRAISLDNQVFDFGLIMFDIDYFKVYNDTNGHLAGDELLQGLAAVVKSVLFTTDILCRYGGEEFAIICCETSPKGLGIAAEKIRKTVEDYEFEYQENQPGGILTISVGAAYYSSIDMTKDGLIKKADDNLYISKKQGRNQTTYQRLYS